MRENRHQNPYMRSREQRGVGQGGSGAGRHLDAGLRWRGAAGGGGAGQTGRGMNGALAAL